jgi:hypothetical protein
MNYIIEDKLLKSIVDYLAQRPFAEVHQFIAELVKLSKQPVKPPQDQPAKSD